jgi:hypothetical protein
MIIIKCYQALTFDEIRYNFCNNVTRENVTTSLKYNARGAVIWPVCCDALDVRLIT